MFSFGNTTFVSRRIEGNFPDYRQLLPPSCATAVAIDVPEFSAALKRVSAIAVQNASVRFDVDVDGALMRMSASSIALNYHYVSDCLAAVSGNKEMRLELQGPTQPGIFKCNGRVNYLYLLMPVRL